MHAYLELENVSIDIPVYGVDMSFRSALVETCIGGNLKKQKKTIIVQALKDINLKLNPGDRLGLIGHNGAGKTTLLSVMAGIYKPLIGTVKSRGRISSLFNLGLGMDLVDTGLQNITTIGLYLGMSKKEIAAKTEDIVMFSGLADFIHLPLRTYSAGMIARLTFAIATAQKPDILLIDEGIGAGDQAFAAKAKQRLDNFYNEIGIIVLASHSNELIRQLCNKAILLEHGKIIAAGSIDEVLGVYS